jgi:hypothetical protein
MSDEMKAALWRIVLTHLPSFEPAHAAERGERLLRYKFRLLAWIERGGTPPIPEPQKRSYRVHWSLYRKIAAELGNHLHDDLAAA